MYTCENSERLFVYFVSLYNEYLTDQAGYVMCHKLPASAIV